MSKLLTRGEGEAIKGRTSVGTGEQACECLAHSGGIKESVA